MPASASLVLEHTCEETSMACPPPVPCPTPGRHLCQSCWDAIRATTRRLLQPSVQPAFRHDPLSPENQQRLNHDAAARNGGHVPPAQEPSACATSPAAEGPCTMSEARLGPMTRGAISRTDQWRQL